MVLKYIFSPLAKGKNRYHIPIERPVTAEVTRILLKEKNDVTFNVKT